jgi:hypothetical protein
MILNEGFGWLYLEEYMRSHIASLWMQRHGPPIGFVQKFRILTNPLPPLYIEEVLSNAEIAQEVSDYFTGKKRYLSMPPTTVTWRK